MKLKIKIIVLSIIVLSFSCNCFAGSNVEHIFDLAKYSTCKDVAEDILKNPLFTPAGKPTGRAGYYISRLNSLTATPFPYRFEITNGYKEGFVYYALLGYLNEMNGNIPLAYRCYQNSLACIDEDKSFSHPLPRAEIYLAIGRTCLAAGRYMDAKDWLDNAFFEAGDNKQLQAAIDRVLIQRANEIGDYPEIIFLYQHLLSLANDNNSPPLKGETGGCKLTKEDYANYSQILFWSRKDREGFSKLLEGISKLGIDNNLGVKDPLVDMFLNNIMRADDFEIQSFYDLLGYEIMRARSLKGDEKHLAFLYIARNFICKMYGFIIPENDFKNIKMRIEQVKIQLAQQTNTIKVALLKRKRKKKIQRSSAYKDFKIITEKTNASLISPEIYCEELLMQADLLYNIHKPVKAFEKYNDAYIAITNKALGYKIYDGTTYGNAAIAGCVNTAMSQYGKKAQAMYFYSNMFMDGSLRSSIAALSILSFNTGAVEKSIVEMKKIIETLPKAHPVVLSTYGHAIFVLYKTEEYEYQHHMIKNYIKRTSNIPSWLGLRWIGLHLAQSDVNGALQALIECCNYSQNKEMRRNIDEMLSEIWSFASDKVLDVLERKRAGFAVSFVLQNYDGRMKDIYTWLKISLPKERKMRKLLLYAQRKDIEQLLNKDLLLSDQCAHHCLRNVLWLSLGETNKAAIAYRTAQEKYIKKNINYRLEQERWTNSINLLRLPYYLKENELEKK